jgi:hypothetical protein
MEEQSMKQLISAVFMVVVLAVTAAPAAAGWNSCVACHNGSVAPDKDKLKEKHKTIEAFVKAAQASQNPLMQSIQKDEKALREAAREIGLQ